MRRVLVTTLHCGEGDYEACMQMVAAQRGVVIEHVTVHDMLELEAHNALLKSWNDRVDEFDAFAKIDADTVLVNEDVLASTVELLFSSPSIAATQSPLLDYYTDGPINGLNCYSKLNTFNVADDKLFCDRSIVHHGRVLYGDSMGANINPAGFHCFRSTPEQAFHFGLHRGLKKQLRTCELVKSAVRKHGDRLRKLALAGFVMSSVFRDQKISGTNYGDAAFKEAFAKASVDEDLERVVARVLSE